MNYLENIETAFFADLNKRAAMPGKAWRFVPSTKAKYKQHCRLCRLYRQALRLGGARHDQT